MMIDVTSAERAAGALSEQRLVQAREAITADGFVILGGVVDPAHLDVLHERLIADLELLRRRRDAPFNWHVGNVQQDPPPFAPFLFADVLVNPVIIQVAAAVLGPALKNTMYGGNTALPSEGRQPVHADVGHLWPVEVMQCPHPPVQLVVNIATVDVSVDNGSTEIWPGTHRSVVIGAGQDIKIPAEALAARRAEVAPVQPCYPRGSAVLRDVRLWHAGMPNRTDVPRPMTAQMYAPTWLAQGSSLRFPVGTEEFFAHPVLRQDAEFVAGEIDYINAPQAYEYEPRP